MMGFNIQMKFWCAGCSKECDFEKNYGMTVITSEKELVRYCRKCRSPKAAVPDVYFDGKPELTLANDPETGQPRTFSSKEEKAGYLKERGLMEAGDRVHGAPMTFSQNQERPAVESRAAVQAALMKVKGLSPNERRHEYFKLLDKRR